MSQPQAKTQFDLSGGNLALDFVNTVSHRPTLAIERLPDYRSLVAFGMQARVYPSNVDKLLNRDNLLPGQGKNVLQRAVQFREALYAIFSAIVEHRTVPGKPVGLLNSTLQEAMMHGMVLPDNRRFIWQWIGMDTHMDSILWPIARSAANLLLNPDLAHLRMCAAEDCAWLFLDHTKNQRRRWCDMKVCGNRVKARRYYERLQTR
jgi:predicted RNA-binding Zn ribbon-like protein